MIEGTEHFGVSVLGKGQERIAEIFGTKSGRDTNKYNTLGIDPFLGAKDIPLIPESLAAFVCKKVHAVEIGDHFAVFGEVVEAWKGPETRPLRWFRSKFDI
jgi:flavin reductase (DIM6/NTAB) family NADH-FMN oxidoreductase RutF